MEHRVTSKAVVTC